MTGMPRNFRPIIGRGYTGPDLDRPALRRMPSHWTLEESRKPLTAWWRFIPNPDRLIFWLCVLILVFAALSAFGAFTAHAADKPGFPRAEPMNPIWTSIKRCRDQGRTWLASSSDGRAWKVRCTGRPIRT